MITEDYVSFETAKLLKEKGFEGFTMFSYSTKGTTMCGHWENEIDWVPKCTLQMAMKWLLKKYNIFICILFLEESNGFGYTIENIVKKEYITTSKNDGYSTYEETAEEAIKYCLENLI